MSRRLSRIQKTGVFLVLLAIAWCGAPTREGLNSTTFVITGGALAAATDVAGEVNPGVSLNLDLRVDDRTLKRVVRKWLTGALTEKNATIDSDSRGSVICRPRLQCDCGSEWKFANGPDETRIVFLKEREW